MGAIKCEPHWKHRPGHNGGVITPPLWRSSHNDGTKTAEGEKGTGQAHNCPRGNLCWGEEAPRSLPPEGTNVPKGQCAETANVPKRK